MYKLHFDNFLINEHDDDDGKITDAIWRYSVTDWAVVITHPHVVSYFPRRQK